MVVQLEAGFHPVIIVEFNEGKTTTLLFRVVFLGGDANFRRRILLKVLRDRLRVCRVRQVTLKDNGGSESIHCSFKQIESRTRTNKADEPGVFPQ